MRLRERLFWVWSHWYLPVALFFSVLIYGVFRRGGHASAQQKLTTELAAAAAKLEVSQISVQRGTDAALLHVRQVYAGRIAALDAKERHDADKFRADPAALAVYLMRLGGKPGAGG